MIGFKGPPGFVGRPGIKGGTSLSVLCTFSQRPYSLFGHCLAGQKGDEGYKGERGPTGFAGPKGDRGFKGWQSAPCKF